MASQSFFTPRALTAQAADARKLLYSYPDISDQELAILIGHFRKLPLLDFGLLAADEKLGPKLDAFYADHGNKLRSALTWAEWAIAIAMVAGVFALLYLALV